MVAETSKTVPLLQEKLWAVTVVTPDLEASIAFYREALGYELLRRGTLAEPVPAVEGAGEAGRLFALLRGSGGEAGTVRLLEASGGTPPNRPRPTARAWDPGLAVLEFITKDPERSYAQVTGFGAKTLSKPLPYLFRNAGALGDIDVVSYSAFGPAGEQMFITRSVGPKRAPAEFDGLHGRVGNVVIPNLDRNPVLAFYEAVFGIVATVDSECQQETVNEIINAPSDTLFQMIMLGEPGETAGIEVEEYRVASGTTYPTSLGRTGLSMATFHVTDLKACRARCLAGGIEIAAEGALPLEHDDHPSGFILRGAVGELIEVVGPA